MKRILLFLLFTVIPLSVVCGQTPDYSVKFGKPTEYELKMARYEPDTTAHAVVLYESTDFRYDYNKTTGFQLVCDYEVKIKVLDQEGASWGDVSISHYDAGHERREVVSRISASSYNMENGKMVKKSVERKDIHKEEVSENRFRTKFSIPDVKAGSVIEYRYEITSDLLANMPDLRFQYSIPIRYKTARVSTPEYFDFAMNTKGYNIIAPERKKDNGSIHFGSDVVTYTANVYIFTVNEIPALKDEPFVWTKSDFASAVEFELRSTRFPNSMIRSYSTTWDSVNKRLSENSYFTSGLNYGNPYKQEIAAIMGGEGDDYDKLRAIHKLVMSRIAWNDYYSIYSKNIRDAVRVGTGMSSDINFILRSAIIDAGYGVDLVLLNPRQFGRLPYTRPSSDKINTFVLMVAMPDGKTVFLDGTDRDSDLNVLPEELMADRARIYGVSGERGWVDLTNIARNRVSVTITGAVDMNGLFTGKMMSRYGKAPSLSVKKNYRKAKSEDEYIEDMEDRMKISVSDYEIKGLDSDVVLETIDFTYQMSCAGGKIYVRPTVIPFMDSNPFTLQERMLPVEFSYPAAYTYNVSLTLPEGMAVEEMPSNTVLSDGQDGLKYISLFQNSGSMISSRNTFECNQIIYPVTEYDIVYTFFGTAAESNQRRIVVSKQ